MTYRFLIPGKLVGKGRPKATIRAGHAAVYTPAKTREFEGFLRHQFAEGMAGRVPLTCPVRLDIRMLVLPPKRLLTKPGRVKIDRGDERPTSKPDFDNVIKAICDAMNNIVFDDDKQIVECHFHKEFSYKREEAAIVVIPLGPIQEPPDDPFDG